MSWTDERVELLKSMWSEGKSASQIAKTLGGVTRNAVIGKVHRLGLSNRTAAPGGAAAEADEPAPATAAPRPAPAAAPTPEPEPAPRAAEPLRAVEPPAPAPEPVERPATRVSAPLPTSGPQPPAPSEVSEEARRSLAEVEKRARRLDLLQLTERTCKWPIGDPATSDFFFCGLPSLSGKPYCETHVSVAFQPMSARRDRSRSR